MKILAFESSCDETAVAVVEDGRKILSDAIASQADLHALYGGVVPEIASRKHIEAICGVCDECLDVAAAHLGLEHLTWSDLDAVAVTHSDDDHCGSLPVLGDVAPAAALLVPEGLPACGCRACAELMEAAEAEGLADDLVELSLGDTVRCGRFSLTVLWP